MPQALGGGGDRGLLRYERHGMLWSDHENVLRDADPEHKYFHDGALGRRVLEGLESSGLSASTSCVLCDAVRHGLGRTSNWVSNQCRRCDRESRNVSFSLPSP